MQKEEATVRAQRDMTIILGMVMIVPVQDQASAIAQDIN